MQRGKGTLSALRLGEEIGAGYFDVHAVLGFHLGIEHFVNRCAAHSVLNEFVLHLKGVFVFFGVVGRPVDNVVVNRKSA